MYFTFFHWHSCEVEYDHLVYLQSVRLLYMFSWVASAAQPELYNYTGLDQKGLVSIYTAPVLVQRYNI